MKSVLLKHLICPACLPQEFGLLSEIERKAGEDILLGKLICPACDHVYSIRHGVATLLPPPDPKKRQAVSKYESPCTLAPYIWSHYGDLIMDPEAGDAYVKWAELLDANPGFSLDTGCAVGRFTLELGRKSGFAVGIDSSQVFVRAARDLMKKRQLELMLPEEGTLKEAKAIRLPGKWESARVEFMVADAQALPFPSGCFSIVASLNLVDKIPVPLKHLRELNRVARDRRAQILISDPFSWSTEVAREEDWLGGTSHGPFAGRGHDNIIRLLRGEIGDLQPPWDIHKQGHTWWKIRNHRNHFELIRSCFIKAQR